MNAENSGVKRRTRFGPGGIARKGLVGSVHAALRAAPFDQFLNRIEEFWSAPRLTDKRITAGNRSLVTAEPVILGTDRDQWYIFQARTQQRNLRTIHVGQVGVEQDSVEALFTRNIQGVENVRLVKHVIASTCK